ncbi:MAG: protein phosphatase 1 regulatory subunit 42 [Sporocytophaga sp.]|nr:protein phosphatase 1 regulatory subunit 42 [Sporocytophaga sp.]
MAFVLVGFKVIAQDHLVEIPDPNFRAKLELSYPSLMKDGKLDTIKAASVFDELILESSNINDVTGITYFKNISILKLSKNHLTTIPDISGLTNLRGLYLSYNNITSLPDLSTLVNLWDLQVQNNLLKKLPALPNSSNLGSLYFAENLITELPDLSGYVNLEYLIASKNKVNGFQDVSAFKKLKELHLNDMGIDKITGLQELHFLEKFYGQSNLLTDLSDLKTNTTLKTFNVGNNNLSSLPDLLAKPNLNEVDISGNYLTFEDILPLQNHPQFSKFNYSFQKEFIIDQNLELKDQTDSFIYDPKVDVTLPVTYQWFKNGIADNTNKSSALTLSPLTPEQSGKYYQEIRLAALPSLVLKSTDMDIKVKPCIELSYKSLNILSENCKEGYSIEIQEVEYKGGTAPYRFGIKSISKSDTLTLDNFRYNNLEAGIYKFTVSDQFNCKGSTSSFTLQKPKDCQAVFSPNGDGYMDSYFIESPGKIKILDSGRNLIRELIAPAVWDGTKTDGSMADAGYYAIVINENNVINITLIR